MGKPKPCLFRELKRIPKEFDAEQPLRMKRDRERAITLNGLRRLRAPMVVSVLVSLVYSMPHLIWTQETDHAELFSGCMSVTRGELEAGRTCSVFDLTYHEDQNILTAKGFALALYHVLHVKRGGSLTLAPVCSTWVYMSRGSTRRSKAEPLGSNTGATWEGNVMAARVAIIVMIAAARGLFWVLEQPKGSLFEMHPTMQKVFGLIRVHRKSINMGSYGAPSLKPTWLYSGHGAILNDIDQFQPPSLPDTDRAVLVKHYVDGSGKKRITGSTSLKASQSYPIEFGRALARLRTKHARAVRITAKQVLKKACGPPKKRAGGSLPTWVKASNLHPVLEYLS